MPASPPVPDDVALTPAGSIEPRIRFEGHRLGTLSRAA
jgi:hypothetical protein